MFGRLGAKVISADEVGHRVLEDPEVKEKLLEEFGRGILREDGRIDRRKLGRMVFGDREALRRLDAIVHPPLLRLLKEEETCGKGPFRGGGPHADRGTDGRRGDGTGGLIYLGERRKFGGARGEGEVALESLKEGGWLKFCS